MFSFLNKYVIGTAAYSFVRKPIVLSNYEIERADSTYSNKTYRNLLYLEIFSITMVDVLMSQFIAPIHSFQDLQSFEIKLRGLQEDVYLPDKFKAQALDLCFV